MSDLELVSRITEENKRRKGRRIVLTALYFESVVLGVAYLSSQREPRDLGCFSDEESRHNFRKYLLKEMYDGSEVTCYENLRLTTINFHDLCMLGDMMSSFDDALKSTKPLPLPHVTLPSEILAALQVIPDLARCDLLQSYGKLILNERLFQALMELPMDMGKNGS
ncbi:hypothetical protein BAE44_0015589 [Dichanthelium oligosanthes]|uniref:Uncharacterized protein n=1 Tax=Dichanthelium oligosanthes TaxID=888268 RepID=A0A1E5VE21_9POAL|nr:hypothetical protein BAE44_0015589 [Dichanthelium oligosanthes]